jgi:hypothetical protein
VTLFMDFFCELGADEIYCKRDILDVLGKMLSIQPFNLPTMNDKLRELKIYNKTDDEMDILDYSKSSFENAFNKEMREIIISRK